MGAKRNGKSRPEAARPLCGGASGKAAIGRGLHARRLSTLCGPSLISAPAKSGCPARLRSPHATSAAGRAAGSISAGTTLARCSLRNAGRLRWSRLGVRDACSPWRRSAGRRPGWRFSTAPPSAPATRRRAQQKGPGTGGARRASCPGAECRDRLAPSVRVHLIRGRFRTWRRAPRRRRSPSRGARGCRAGARAPRPARPPSRPW